jgi:hypothetical protein
MTERELRLECLKLAVIYGSAKTAVKPANLAAAYFAFVRGEKDVVGESRERKKAGRGRPVGR